MSEESADALPAQDVTARLESALAFARGAGDVAMRYFGGGGFSVDTKRDGSVVTTADREAEQLIRSHIQRAFPDDGVLGEEFGERASTSGWRWVLDPIDGTASFVHGVPLFGTLIACEFERQTLVGVMHMPALAETVYARAGGGAWHVRAGTTEAVQASVSRARTIADSMMCTTSYEYFRATGREEALQTMFDSFGSTRGWSDCYAHVLCATGRIDAVVEPLLHPWDIAPMHVIYREAGGRSTDWAGRSGAYHPTGVSTNGLVHDELLGLLSPFSA